MPRGPARPDWFPARPRARARDELVAAGARNLASANRHCDYGGFHDEAEAFTFNEAQHRRSHRAGLKRPRGRPPREPVFLQGEPRV